MCSLDKADGPGYRDFRNRAGTFPIRTSQTGYRDEDFSNKQTTKFIPPTRPAQVLGSYEEALRKQHDGRDQA